MIDYINNIEENNQLQNNELINNIMNLYGINFNQDIIDKINKRMNEHFYYERMQEYLQVLWDPRTNKWIYDEIVEKADIQPNEDEVFDFLKKVNDINVLINHRELIYKLNDINKNNFVSYVEKNWHRVQVENYQRKKNIKK